MPLSLPAPPASFQKSLHLPLCFLSHCCTLRLSFLFFFPSLSPTVIYSSLSDSSLNYFFLSFQVWLVCLSAYVCFAGELVSVRLAVWALLTVMLSCRFETEGAASRDRNKQINVECSCPFTSLISVYVLRAHRVYVCVFSFTPDLYSEWQRCCVSQLLSLMKCVCLEVSAYFLGGCKHLSLSSLCVYLCLSLWIQLVLCHWCPLYVSSSPMFQMTVTGKEKCVCCI